MRFVAIIAIAWSFVGMPTLCRAGVLIECCTQGIPGHGNSHNTPDNCPGGCPCDKPDEAPDDKDSSNPRDCDSCTESCNVVSTHSKQTNGEDSATLLAAEIAVAQVPCDAFLTHQHHRRSLNTIELDQNIPVPPSDRPLLI